MGEEGEKIGELVACWLAKWGSTILGVEEALVENDEGVKRAVLEEGREIQARKGEVALPKLRVWGGMEARWVRGVMASDAFFVGGSGEGEGSSGEFGRYITARRVVELRRREKERAKMGSGRGGKAAEGEGEGEEEREDEVGSENAETGDEEGVGESAGEEEVKLTQQEPERRGSDMEEHDGDEDEADEEEQDKVEEDEDEEEYQLLFETGIHYSHLVRHPVPCPSLPFPSLSSLTSTLTLFTVLLTTPIHPLRHFPHNFKALRPSLPPPPRLLPFRRISLPRPQSTFLPPPPGWSNSDCDSYSSHSCHR